MQHTVEIEFGSITSVLENTKSSQHERVTYLQDSAETLNKIFPLLKVQHLTWRLKDKAREVIQLIFTRCMESTRSTLVKCCGIELIRYCVVIIDDRETEESQKAAVIAVRMLQEAKEGTYQSTEELIMESARVLRELHCHEKAVEDSLLELLDSKVSFQRSGATGAIEILHETLKVSIVGHLMARLRARESVSLKESAIILYKFGEEKRVGDTLLELLDPRINTKISSDQLREVIGAISFLQLIGKDSETTEKVILSLINLLEYSKDDNWLKMEVVQSIEALGFYDNRLINALDMCLRRDGKGINTQGLRNASVHALQSFGVPPNGRECLEIFWRDKLRRGESKIFKAGIILSIVALMLFAVLFFSLVFPDIASMSRATAVTGIITGVKWTAAFGCRALCFDGRVEIEYMPVDETSLERGYAEVSCSSDTEGCACCFQYYVNRTLDCYYDSGDYSKMFLSLSPTNSFKTRLFHSIFWPGMLLTFPLLSLWPYTWYSWRQSRAEKGKPFLSCCPTQEQYVLGRF